MTNRRKVTLQSLHAKEDQALRKVIGQGIAAYRAGVARESNPFTGNSYRRNWFNGWDWEAKRQEAQPK